MYRVKTMMWLGVYTLLFGAAVSWLALV